LEHHVTASWPNVRVLRERDACQCQFEVSPKSRGGGEGQ
jgi:hypothetical protein